MPRYKRGGHRYGRRIGRAYAHNGGLRKPVLPPWYHKKPKETEGDSGNKKEENSPEKKG